MPAPSIIMGLVAFVAAIAGIVVATRRAPTEASVYRHRITATVLIALGVMLGVYAWALHGWEGVA